MNKRLKEIRRILSSKIAYDEEYGLIVAERNVFRRRSGGYHRGADSIRWFGVRVVRIAYDIKGKKVDDAKLDAVRAVLGFGKQAFLRSSPNTLAVLCRPIVFAPYLLTLDEIGDKRLLFSIYMPRTILRVLNERRILKKWELDKPQSLEELDDQPAISEAEIAEDTEPEKEE